MVKWRLGSGGKLMPKKFFHKLLVVIFGGQPLVMTCQKSLKHSRVRGDRIPEKPLDRNEGRKKPSLSVTKQDVQNHNQIPCLQIRPHSLPPMLKTFVFHNGSTLNPTLANETDKILII